LDIRTVEGAGDRSPGGEALVAGPVVLQDVEALAARAEMARGRTVGGEEAFRVSCGNTLRGAAHRNSGPARGGRAGAP